MALPQTPFLFLPHARENLLSRRVWYPRIIRRNVALCPAGPVDPRRNMEGKRPTDHANQEPIWTRAGRNTRGHRFLEAQTPREHGLLVQDRNETVARRLTDLMRDFHAQGTRWTTLPLIVETPLFVDSRLTSLVQVADMCSYATRRYCENGERPLFDVILPKFHVADDGRLVGARHYTGQRRCGCDICRRH